MPMYVCQIKTPIGTIGTLRIGYLVVEPSAGEKEPHSAAADDLLSVLAFLASHGLRIKDTLPKQCPGFELLHIMQELETDSLDAQEARGRDVLVKSKMAVRVLRTVLMQLGMGMGVQAADVLLGELEELGI